MSRNTVYRYLTKKSYTALYLSFERETKSSPYRLIIPPPNLDILFIFLPYSR